MARIVGMTTNPDERKRYWQGKYQNLHKWMIVARYDNKSDAQLAERHFAARMNAVANGEAVGGENDEWVIYRFDH